MERVRNIEIERTGFSSDQRDGAVDTERGSRQDDILGTIDGANGNLSGSSGGEDSGARVLRSAAQRAHHSTRHGVLNDRCACTDQAQAILDRHNTGDDRRGVLTEAVPHYYTR